MAAPKNLYPAMLSPMQVAPSPDEVNANTCFRHSRVPELGLQPNATFDWRVYSDVGAREPPLPWARPLGPSPVFRVRMGFRDLAGSKGFGRFLFFWRSHTMQHIKARISASNGSPKLFGFLQVFIPKVRFQACMFYWYVVLLPTCLYVLDGGGGVMYVGIEHRSNVGVRLRKHFRGGGCLLYQGSST